MKLMGLCLIAGVLLATALGAQENPFSEGSLLHLDFNQDVDGRFVDAQSGLACEVKGTARKQDGAVQISQFTAFSVPEFDASEIVEDLTLSAWVAPSERPNAYQTLLYKGKRQGAAVQEIHFFLSLFAGRPELKFKDENGRWRGIMRNGDFFSIPGSDSVPLADVPALDTLRWNHVAATFTRGEIALYVNGEKTLSGGAGADHLVPNEYPLMIGEAQAVSGPRSYLFIGLMDDVRIYSRAMPAEEIAGLYEHERQGKPDGPLQIEKPLPEGYDPEFKTKLPLVAAYEQNMPHGLDGREPVVSEIKSVAGLPSLYVNGRPVYAMAMMPEPYASDELVTLSCRDFAAAGVDLYSEIFWSWSTPGDGCSGWWLGEGEYDFARMDRRIEAIVRGNPRALIFPRVKLNPPNWWLKAHPDEIARDADGKTGQQASLASELWEAAYEKMLRDVIRHMESSDYAGHILGYHPAGGRASEWFWWGTSGRVDFSPSAKTSWRGWLRDQYGDDVEALREAWGDQAATFESAEPPSPQERLDTLHGVFRHPVKQRPVIDYRRFLSDKVSRNIDRSCRIVKEETGGKKIAGVFYGYSTYCHNQDGFQGLEAVLNSPHVDFLASPTAYDRRRGGEVGGHISAYNGSYRLHNKLYWDEVDTRTHLYPGHVGYRTDDLDETLAVHQRAVGYSLTKGTNLWWFLLAGNPTFHQAEVMEDIARLRNACEDAVDKGREPVAQVAVFADEDSMHLAPGDVRFRSALLRETMNELGCMGAPYDVYLLPDIAHPDLPEYKLYIFLNAFRVDEELRDTIKRTVRRDGKTAAWVYAPGYVKEDGFDVAGIAEMTGIRVQMIDGECQAALTVTARDHDITRSAAPQRDDKWQISPVFVVDDPSAIVLGTTAGRPSLAVSEFASHRSVYSMLPLKRDLLQGLCRYAGVHVYSESSDPFFAGAGYAMIHTATHGLKRILLPEKADVVELVTGQEVGKGLSVIEEHLPAGVTRIYRLGEME